MAAACRATSFGRVSVVKHRVTLVAKAPTRLRSRRPLNIMRKNIAECIVRFVTAARRTASFFLVTVEKHRLAIPARTPVSLRSRCFLAIERQAELISLSDVPSTGRTDVGLGVGIKHHVALVAESPIGPILRYR